MSSKLQGKGPKTLETHLALVVRRVDKAIQQIAWFAGVCWIVIYPVDSVIQPSNNSGLKGEGSHPIFFQRMEPKSWFCVVECPSKVLEVLAQKKSTNPDSLPTRGRSKDNTARNTRAKYSFFISRRNNATS